VVELGGFGNVFEAYGSRAEAIESFAAA